MEKALALRTSTYLISLERELKEERNLILLPEELLWHQKSRNKWLKCGDGNTKFFCTSTLVRRRRNRIESMVDSEGRRVEGRVTLKTMAVELYSKLFRADQSRGGDFTAGHFPDLLQLQREVWDAEWTMSKAKKSLSEMGSWKAPGLDGYQPGFFKRTWDVTGQSLYRFVDGLLKEGEVTKEDLKALLVMVPKETKPYSIK